ncbi:ParB N-terminal domain-containing protein [Ectopseudomonas mendocina]|uniref:hypothetical protein n=1 Tax=Ectopseudomonas mendocina TaxID=300 RepID=UPI00376F0205
MRNWLARHFACAIAHANAWRYLSWQGGHIKDLPRLRIPNSALKPFIFIDPMKLESKCNIRGRTQLQKTLLRDGDWDIKRKSFIEVEASDSRYISCQELLNGVPLEQTVEFRLLRERLARHGEARGMKSQAQLISYMQKTKSLYQQVAAEGRLRTQAELGRCSYGGEINCAISRDGQLLKTDDGNHRFAVARYLKLSHVPVQISVIHSDFIISNAATATDINGVKYLDALICKVVENYQ